jgi:dTDP-glucose pyrophosphorylase
MWGIVPAAGLGSRIQPLAFSKELLPVGSKLDGEVERPRAVCEYLLERMVAAGATRICLVIGPGKADVLHYFGGRFAGATLAYVVQPEPAGLCDAIFRALPLVAPDDHALVGLPDTVWVPEAGLAMLGDEDLSFLLFPVDRPDRFDAVVADEHGHVREIQVKSPRATTRWVWGAFKVRGAVLAELEALWRSRSPRDPYLGTLVNAWLARGGVAHAVRGGRQYVDVGTLEGWRAAEDLLARGGRDGGITP